MASYDVSGSRSATLTGTTIDVLTVTSSSGRLSILNRGAATFWVRAGRAPADPTVAGDGCIPIAPGQPVALGDRLTAGWVVKILGNGEAYTVYQTPSSGRQASDADIAALINTATSLTRQAIDALP